ncbi:MAG: hypothetical protein ACTSW7_01330 [Candidatus Thorarchaeota archaeon]|nr:hypothetical protein [Thermoplasmatales archaeon]
MCSEQEQKAHNEMVRRIREQVDATTFSMSKQLIDTSIRMVLHNVANKYENEMEYLDALDRIMGNVVNFVALVVLQLHEFGKGTNEGPFINMFEELLERNAVKQ